MSELVKRLRKGDRFGDCKHDRCMCPEMDEAADEITRLTAEVERLREMQRTVLVEQGEMVATLTARVRELEGALAVRPKKPRRNETQLYHLGNMNGEEAWQKGWQEALTAMGTARKAALSVSQPAPITDRRYNNAERIFGDD